MRKNKLLLLLALLMTAATGAWAQTETLLTTITPTGNDSYSETTPGVVTVTPSGLFLYSGANGWMCMGSGSLTVEAKEGYTITKCVFKQNDKTPVTISTSPFAITFANGKCVEDAKLAMDGVTSIEVYAPAAPAGYTVSLKDGVKDADKWTISPNPAEEGQTVTLQYTGRLKVKGVKATSEAAPAEATPALSITSPSVGQVIGSDGKNYAYGSLPTGVTAVAKICYVSGSNGLALALADEGKMEWSTAIETCAAHTAPFTGGTWKLATKDEWDNMINAAGSYSALRDGFISVGGTNMNSDDYYWSSTENGSYFAWYYDDYDQEDWDSGDKEYELYVRACLAFTVEQAKEPATVTTAPTGAAIVGVGKSTELVSGGVADGGTLMYAVTTTNTKPTSTAGFSDAVPTAKDITASGKVYVWYYVKADDSHSDSEIAATAIEVPVADIVWDVTNVTDLGVFEGDPYEKEGVTMSSYSGNVFATWTDNGDPTTDGIAFQAYETGGYTFTAPAGKAFTKIEMNAVGPDGWDSANLGTGWALLGDMSNPPTVTWTGSAASTVGLLTDDGFEGALVKSIAFYLSE